VSAVPRPPAATRPIRAWWWREASHRTNFGDELGWLLLERITSRRVERTALGRCDVVSVGSLLETVLRHGAGNRPLVWGAGFLAPGEAVSRDALAFAAVRGRLTRERIAGGDDVALGDPGLLAPLLLDDVPPRRDRIAFLPHRHDRGAEAVRAFAARPEVDLLDVHASPLDVLAGIASCRFVLSSSLHGLVVADALGVPSCWVEPTTRVEGAGYKFRDYYSLFDMEPPCASLADWPADPWARVAEHEAAWRRPGIDALRAGLLDALRHAGL
jgi:hypothetical protein